MLSPKNTPFALFDDATWPDRPALLLTGQEGFVEAHTADDVARALGEIEGGTARGLIAAGYCAYELGYVFEPRLLPLLPETQRPLLRFHLFRSARRLSPGARWRWLTEHARGPATAGEASPSLTAAAHGAKVSRVRQLIGDGDVYQVNLTFKLCAAAGDPFATYAALRSKARAGACSFIRFDDEDVLSFSPELFFRVKGGRIEARPMKGTRARGASAEDDASQRAALLGDEKEQAENLMIVDLLRNDLSCIAKCGSVKVTDLFTVETYPQLHTLTSGITAELDGEVSFSRALRALFPCGSVTGAPKIRAMEIIREVEESPRGVYCGAIGYVARGAMAFSVAIRTLVLRDGQAEMGVGGGIVWDSQAAAEYDESLLKARFFTEMQEPIRLIETMRWTPENGFHLLVRHLARLRASSGYFGFVCDEARVRQALDAAVVGKDGALRVRLTLGERGDVDVAAEPFALPASDTVWRYVFAADAVSSSDWRMHHKTTARDFYDRALAAARAATGCDEVVFVNERGEVTEGSRTNIFLERNGVWLTPPLRSGLLDGCLRREMIASGRAVEGVLTRHDLIQGRVWFGNSLRGMIRGEAVAAGLVANAAQ